MHTFYLTRWALTRGVVKVEGCELLNGGSHMRRTAPGVASYFEKIGEEAFLSEDEAKERVVEKVKKRLNVVLKEKQKLESLIQLYTMGKSDGATEESLGRHKREGQSFSVDE